MKRVACLIGILLVLSMVQRARAQLIVTDPLNLAENIIQAAQTVIMVENQLLELTGLDEIVLSDDMNADLDTLAGLGQEAGGLITDVATIQQQVILFFDLDSAPATSLELQQRLMEVRRLSWRVYTDAMSVEIILQSTVSALRHFVRLLGGIQSFIGNNQANMSLNQIDAKLTIELAKLREQTSAYHRAKIVDGLTDALIAQSMFRIQEQVMSDWPRP